MVRPRTGHAFFDDVEPPAVIAMAHRGGAEHPDLVGLENTYAAFAHAVGLGYEYLETDVHVTSCGTLVAFHDDVLDRVTDRSGAVSSAPVEAWRGARIAGEHPIPELAHLLEEFPRTRFNIDLKSDRAALVLAQVLARTGAQDRVCVGSFSRRRLRAFRAATQGKVATSASPAEFLALATMPTAALGRAVTRHAVSALQVPHRRNGVALVTPSLVRRAHAAGAHVHVWTVDDPHEMEELLDHGVDGLITDRTDLLKSVLESRGSWRAAP